MKKRGNCFCRDISDKDFIYEIFSNNGFVQNADSFLSSSNKDGSSIDGQHQETLQNSELENRASTK